MYLWRQVDVKIFQEKVEFENYAIVKINVEFHHLFKCAVTLNMIQELYICQNIINQIIMQ